MPDGRKLSADEDFACTLGPCAEQGCEVEGATRCALDGSAVFAEQGGQ